MDQRTVRPVARAVRQPMARTSAAPITQRVLSSVPNTFTQRDADPDSDKPDADDKKGKSDSKDDDDKDDKEERGKDDLYTGDGDS